MKHIAFLFFLIPVSTFAQYSGNSKTTSVGAEAAIEIGVKAYTLIIKDSTRRDAELSPGGILEIGVNASRQLTDRLHVALRGYWQVSPGGSLMSDNFRDTIISFSVVNVNPTLRFYVPLKRKNSEELTRTKWYGGVGPLFGLSPRIKEKCDSTGHLSVVRYKHHVGVLMESGLDIFVRPHFSVDIGLRFHFMNYSIKSYTEDGTSIPKDQLPEGFMVKTLKASGGGYYASLKFWF